MYLLIRCTKSRRGGVGSECLPDRDQLPGFRRVGMPDEDRGSLPRMSARAEPPACLVLDDYRQGQLTGRSIPEGNRVPTSPHASSSCCGCRPLTVDNRVTSKCSLRAFSIRRDERRRDVHKPEGRDPDALVQKIWYGSRFELFRKFLLFELPGFNGMLAYWRLLTLILLSKNNGVP